MSTDSPAGVPGSSLFLIYAPHCCDSYPVVFTHTHTLPPLLLCWDYVPLPLLCLSASPDPTCPLGMLPGSKQLDKRSSRIQKCPLGAGGSIQLVIGTCLAQGSGLRRRPPEGWACILAVKTLNMLWLYMNWSSCKNDVQACAYLKFQGTCPPLDQECCSFHRLPCGCLIRVGQLQTTLVMWSHSAVWNSPKDSFGFHLHSPGVIKLGGCSPAWKQSSATTNKNCSPTFSSSDFSFWIRNRQIHKLTCLEMIPYWFFSWNHDGFDSFCTPKPLRRAVFDWMVVWLGFIWITLMVPSPDALPSVQLDQPTATSEAQESGSKPAWWRTPPVCVSRTPSILLLLLLLTRAPTHHAQEQTLLQPAHCFK